MARACILALRFIAFISFCCSGWSAAATCGAYPASVGTSDLVFEFKANGSGLARVSPLALAGTSAEGMMVFDSSAKQIKLCDGTSWLAAQTTASAGVAYMASWGSGGYGQLGNTEILPQSGVPIALNSIDYSTVAWKSVSAKSGSVSCAIRLPDERAYCWGSGILGGLGWGYTPTQTPTSLRSPSWGTTAWSQVNIGWSSCGIRKSDSRLFCWGDNYYGNLGTGSTSATGLSSPTELDSVGGYNTASWTNVSVGQNYTCAIRSDDLMFCWGYHPTYGVFGSGTTGYQLSPTGLNPTGGWGGQAQLGVGRTFGQWRLGSTLAWLYEDPVRSEGSISSSGGVERSATVTGTVTRFLSSSSLVMVGAFDQTTFGSPLNTALTQGVSITFQQRWN
jgi:alpha-tubulin suppressor-like RCC1 family protein